MPSQAHFLDQARAAEAVRRQAHEAEAQRQAFSLRGVDLPPFVGKSEVELRAEAARAAGSREAYLTSNLGKARMAIARGCRAAEAIHAGLHDVGAALSRGDGSAVRKAEDAAEALHSLRLLVADVEAFVRLNAAEIA